MTHILETNPKAGSAQEEFERIMLLIGWSKGALSIHKDGGYYLNCDVNMHWQAYLHNSQ